MAAKFCSSPIQNLPVELLKEIFVLASGPVILSSAKENIPALVLSLVCGQWHDIALSTPLLWSSLDLDLDYHLHGIERVQRWTRLVSGILHRSHNSPLSLVVKDVRFDDQSLKTLPIHRELILHCHRWKSLSLHATDALLNHDVFSKARGALASLQSLTLRCAEWEFDQLVTVFENCPSLRHLDTEHHCLRFRELKLPWHQLTSWIVRCSIFPYTVETLAHCDNLKTLIFENFWGSPEDPDNFWDWDSAQVRFLSQIEHLSLLHAVYSWNITYILDAIKAPLLTTLVLEGKETIGTSGLRIVPHIEQLLFHSACSLTSFSAKELPFMTKELLSVLRLMPTLFTLVLHEDPASDCRPIDHSFLKRFVVVADRDEDTDTDVGYPFLPKLTTLELCVLDDGDSDRCSVIFEAMSSRLTSDGVDIARLETLRVYTMSPKDREPSREV